MITWCSARAGWPRRCWLGSARDPARGGGGPARATARGPPVPGRRRAPAPRRHAAAGACAERTPLAIGAEVPGARCWHTGGPATVDPVGRSRRPEPPHPVYPARAGGRCHRGEPCVTHQRRRHNVRVTGWKARTRRKKEEVRTGEGGRRKMRAGVLRKRSQKDDDAGQGATGWSGRE